MSDPDVPPLPLPERDAAASPEGAGLRPAPFFVVGCVRSGVGVLRSTLQHHPGLASPEPTHFFRWSEAFGTEPLFRLLLSNPVLQAHRERDGITESEFATLLRQCTSRAELYNRYMALFQQRRKPTARRWFDATPQNIYGALLAAASMPRAKFVHVVREPTDVVASLRAGRAGRAEPLTAACACWNEAVQIASGLKRAFPARVYELRYEDLLRDPQQQLRLLLSFVDEPFEAPWFDGLKWQPAARPAEGGLSDDEQVLVRTLCGTGRRRYGYEEPAAEQTAGPISNKVPGARQAAKASQSAS
ncbi:sulfotransferase [Ideonella sp.]|uniref:sulfotransferase family protein n=1 Tax=Ideonella sp. TaxID=1929293 RepID=UPI0035B1B819